MDLAQLLAAGTWSGPDYDAAMEAADAADVDAVLALADAADPSTRAAVARCLPLMTHGDAPTPAMVDVALHLTADADPGVRDGACFAVGEQWREVDTPAVRDALAARLDDVDDDVRCEALVGLAYRQDPRALPAVRAALSRSSGELWLLELVAAGALGAPELHDLVIRHLDGWDEDDAATAEAVRRLTGPAGVGDDILEGVADLYRRRAHGRPEADALDAWHRLDAVLEIDPRRAVQALEDVADRLRDDPVAAALLRSSSALAQLAEEQAAQES